MDGFAMQSSRRLELYRNGIKNHGRQRLLKEWQVKGVKKRLCAGGETDWATTITGYCLGHKA
jgi:hypothetical protein